jgi:UDP-N-acetylglucosamine pyrophosphorylase
VCCLQVKHMRSEYGSAVKFILMNSFSTSDDTKAFLAKRHADLLQVRTVTRALLEKQICSCATFRGGQSRWNVKF